MSKDINDDGTVDWLDKLDVDWENGEETVERYPVEELHVTEECADIVEFFEGFRENAYLDPVGIPTLGHGFTYDVKMGDTISYEQSKQRLLKELDYFAQYVNIHVRVPLAQNEYNALTCFTFNLGGGNLANSTLLKKLNEGDYQGAADEFLKWVYAGGEKLQGLVNRREAERKMFLGQQWRG